VILEEYPMNAVIFKTENAVFKFTQKEVKKHLIFKKTEYASDEVTLLLELILTDSDEAIFSSIDQNYFGFVALDLIREGMGTVTCKICGKIYDAGQLKKITVGHGKSPFKINQQQKGGFSLFDKRKTPSMFGGKGFTCPEGHKIISMETWRT
jgi:hypothetical protein